ncbi:MAG: flagellar protein FlaG [Candidatus Competibacteraceae bacterium]
MSDIGSISNLAGANPVLARPAPGARSEQPPAPATVQDAVSPPLTTPQSSVTQLPRSGGAEWQGNANPDGQQKNSATPTRQQLTDTLDDLNQRLGEYNTNLQFEVDDQYQEMVVRIVDRETKEVVRQIPSEKAMAFARFFKELESHQSRPVPTGGKDSKGIKAEGLKGLILQVMA